MTESFYLISDCDAEKPSLGNKLDRSEVSIYLTKHDPKFELFPNKKQAATVLLILHNVEHGATVVADFWKRYSTLTG